MKTPRCLLRAVVLLLIATTAPTLAHGVQIGVTFDESGTQFCTSLGAGEVNVYVVAYDLEYLSGFEFMLEPSYAPAYFLGKEIYGIEPLDFGEQYEVRAGTGGCVGYPTMMGPSPDSWTLARYDLGYFSGIGNDVRFCVVPSPGSGADTPQYTLCDQDATKVPMDLVVVEIFDIDYFEGFPGCALANISYGECVPPVAVDTPSWGALKAQFRQ